MKYIATLNGKRYEVEIERINDFTPVPRGAAAEAIPAAAPIAAPVAPAPAPAPVENEIPAPVAGTVTGILVQKGATVDTDAVLVTLG